MAGRATLLGALLVLVVAATVLAIAAATGGGGTSTQPPKPAVAGEPSYANDMRRLERQRLMNHKSR